MKNWQKGLIIGSIFAIAYILILPYTADPDHMFAKDGSTVTAYDQFMLRIGAWIAYSYTFDPIFRFWLNPVSILLSATTIGLVMDYRKLEKRS